MVVSCRRSRRVSGPFASAAQSVRTRSTRARAQPARCRRRASCIAARPSCLIRARSWRLAEYGVQRSQPPCYRKLGSGTAHLIERTIPITRRPRDRRGGDREPALTGQGYRGIPRGRVPLRRDQHSPVNQSYCWEFCRNLTTQQRTLRPYLLRNAEFWPGSQSGHPVDGAAGPRTRRPRRRGI